MLQRKKLRHQDCVTAVTRHHFPSKRGDTMLRSGRYNPTSAPREKWEYDELKLQFPADFTVTFLAHIFSEKTRNLVAKNSVLIQGPPSNKSSPSRWLRVPPISPKHNAITHLRSSWSISDILVQLSQVSPSLENCWWVNSATDAAVSCMVGKDGSHMLLFQRVAGGDGRNTEALMDVSIYVSIYVHFSAREQWTVVLKV